MIKSIISVPLRELYQKETNLKAPQSERASLILGLLDVAVKPEDLNFPKSGFSKLSGNDQDVWSVAVDDSYRIIFRFENENVLDIDAIDTFLDLN